MVKLHLLKLEQTKLNWARQSKIKQKSEQTSSDRGLLRFKGFGPKTLTEPSVLLEIFEADQEMKHSLARFHPNIPIFILSKKRWINFMSLLLAFLHGKQVWQWEKFFSDISFLMVDGHESKTKFRYKGLVERLYWFRNVQSIGLVRSWSVALNRTGISDPLMGTGPKLLPDLSKAGPSDGRVTWIS